MMSRYLHRLGSRNIIGADDGSGWVWPLTTWWDGRKPVKSDGYQKVATSKHRQHLGVDLMYPRKPGDAWPFPYATSHYVCPPGTLVVAAGDGEIRYMGLSKRGHDMIISHRDGQIRTYYQHLLGFQEGLAKGNQVHKGQILGIAGGDIAPGGYPLHHLHFEIRIPDRYHTVDPMGYLKDWPVVQITSGDLVTPAKEGIDFVDDGGQVDVTHDELVDPKASKLAKTIGIVLGVMGIGLLFKVLPSQSPGTMSSEGIFRGWLEKQPVKTRWMFRDRYKTW